MIPFVLARADRPFLRNGLPMVRTPGAVVDHTFEIRFLDPGVQAYAFTFG
jgi:hypothetical protein